MSRESSVELELYFSILDCARMVKMSILRGYRKKSFIHSLLLIIAIMNQELVVAYSYLTRMKSLRYRK